VQTFYIRVTIKDKDRERAGSKLAALVEHGSIRDAMDAAEINVKEMTVFSFEQVEDHS
jgi:hypothetical protein